jgi:glutamine phosphoribosylpyrophosphate amidotransferase
LSLEHIASLLFPSLVHGGAHAFGWMQYDGDRVTYYKQPGRVTDYPDTITQGFSNESVHWAVGHVRHATTGSPLQNVNNHPISHGNILGVHNGVVRNYQDVLSVTGREDESAEVDSEAIFAAVNKWGHAPGLRKILGDMVAFYVDARKPHLLHVVRSAGRYVSIGWTDRGNVIFSSEKQALLALESKGIKFTSFSSMREMRHLVVRNGQIIYRHTYGGVRTVKSAPATSSAFFFTEKVQRDRLKKMTLPQMERYVRATKEDTIMEVDTDLFYYKGKLLTAVELEEEIWWDRADN